MRSAHVSCHLAGRNRRGIDSPMLTDALTRVEHHQALVHSDLRRSKPHSPRRIHHLHHKTRQSKSETKKRRHERNSNSVVVQMNDNMLQRGFFLAELDETVRVHSYTVKEDIAAGISRI